MSDRERKQAGNSTITTLISPFSGEEMVLKAKPARKTVKIQYLRKSIQLIPRK